MKHIIWVKILFYFGLGHPVRDIADSRGVADGSVVSRVAAETFPFKSGNGENSSAGWVKCSLALIA